MSLVPYVPEQSREIVLRHNSTVVVFDQRSRQLSLRQMPLSDAVESTACPTCHRLYHEDLASPLHNEPGEYRRNDSSPRPVRNTTDWTDPAYFRMLQKSATNSVDASATSSFPSSRSASPQRRIAQTVKDGYTGDLRPPNGAEFVASEPQAPARGAGISSQAFTHNYFNTFFIEEKELGRGGKGIVLLVCHVLDGVSLGHFACKRVPVGDDHGWLEKVLVEVQLLQNLSHQNLVSYRHVWLENYQATSFGPPVPCAFILQQYCDGGDLHHYVLGAIENKITKEELKERMRRRSKGQLEEPKDVIGTRQMSFEEIFSFFKDITAGLHHLHTHGYIHRDLKPSNCLLHQVQGKYRVLVSDFGEVQIENAIRKSTGATGTISYCAPEVLHQEEDGSLGNFTVKSDVFSLGMIVYFMCFGRLPYSNADDINEENEDLDQVRAEISTWAGFDDERRIRDDLPDKLYKFLKRLLSLDPNDRPTTEEILRGIRTGVPLDEPEHDRVLNDLRHRVSSFDPPTPNLRRNSIHTAAQSIIPSPFRLPQSPMDDVSRPRSPVKRTFEHDEQEMQMRARPSQQLALPSPPPSSFAGQLRASLRDSRTVQVLRPLVFFFKLITLLSLCHPFQTTNLVKYSLTLLALGDFFDMNCSEQPWMARSSILRTSFFAVIHFYIVYIAGRHGNLCVTSLG